LKFGGVNTKLKEKFVHDAGENLSTNCLDVIKNKKKTVVLFQVAGPSFLAMASLFRAKSFFLLINIQSKVA
jgi:hypothetical protein